MSTVVVTNKNEEAYSRKFDGTLFEFEPGKEVTIPEEAAAYLFGYGLTDADRQRIVIRNGWQKNGMPNDPQGPKAAMKRLQSFIFKKGPAPKAPEKPVKKVLQSQRELTGINAISTHAKDDGKTILPRDTIRLPGKSAPMAPPVNPV